MITLRAAAGHCMNAPASSVDLPPLPAEPLVSVVIPTFNSARYLVATLDCVFTQTYRNIEIIAADNGSSDETLSLLANYGHRVRVVHESKQGPSAARNRGLGEARGELVAFLDSDDLWPAHKIRAHVDRMKADPGIAATYGDYFLIDEAGKPHTALKSWSTDLAQIPGPATLFAALVTGSHRIQIGSLVSRRDILSSLGGFIETLRTAEDTNLVCRLAHRHRLAFIDGAPVHYRWHTGGTSKQPDVPSGTLASLDMLPTQLQDPSPAELRLLRAARTRCSAVLGRSAFRVGNWTRARELFKDSLSRSPLRPVCWAYLAATYLPPAALIGIKSFKRHLSGP